MNIDKKKYCLILTKSFIPLKIVGVKKTMKYLINNHGRALDTNTYKIYQFNEWIKNMSSKNKNNTIKTEKLWITIPDIIILNKNYIPKIKRENTISKKKIFERDNNKCGYCEKTLSSYNRTIDHIIPISKGGSKNDYHNIVSCCSNCNRIKDNKLLKDLGWKLKISITDPRDSFLYFIPKHKWLSSWKTYLPEMNN